MNILDVIFAVIVGYFLVRGILRGFIVETATLAGAVGGFFLANQYHQALLPYIQKGISKPGVAGVVSYLIIFVSCVVLVTLAATAVKRVLTVSFAAMADRLAGGLFGLAKGGLICCIILMLALRFFPDANFVTQSQSAPYLESVSLYLKKFLPDDISKHVERTQ